VLQRCASSKGFELILAVFWPSVKSLEELGLEDKTAVACTKAAGSPAVLDCNAGIYTHAYTYIRHTVITCNIYASIMHPIVFFRT